MSDRLGYWDIGDNTCDEVEGCKGAGSAQHIDHVLARLPLLRLISAILGHCGNNISPYKSCMCAFYAREIGRRADINNPNRHHDAVKQYAVYREKKYKKYLEESPKHAAAVRMAWEHFGIDCWW